MGNTPNANTNADVDLESFGNDDQTKVETSTKPENRADEGPHEGSHEGSHDEPPSDEVEERDGKKVVDYRALKEARSQNKALKEQLGQLQELVIELLANTPAPKDKTADEPDPKLVKIAKAYGFKTADDEWDLERAAAVRDLLREEASDVVRPLAADTAVTAAQQLRQRAHNKVLDSDGDPIASAAYIDAVLDTLPPQFQAKPEVVNLAMIIAAGLETIDARKKGHTARVSTSRGVTFTERGGRRSDSATNLTPLELAAMRARGKSPEEWAKLSKQADNDILDTI